MAIFPVGGMDLDLEVVGAGVQDGVLPPQLEHWSMATESQGLDSQEASDSRAFRAAGWSFAQEPDLDWPEVKAHNQPHARPGLLARHPAGGLVIIQNRLVLKLSSGKESSNLAKLSERYAEVTKLEYGKNLYSAALRIPDQDLEGAVRRELDLLLSGKSPLGPVSYAEPSLLYHFTRPGGEISHEAFKEAAAAAAGTHGELDAKQWHWTKILLEEAWKQVVDLGENVRVGVIDLGFHVNEPQILHNIDWTAYVDDVGKVFEDGPILPDQHGTFCAGLIGAIKDGLRVNGAAPKCKMVLVALPSNGVFSQEALGNAIHVCAAGMGDKKGVDVISCSLGLSKKDADLQSHLRDAIDSAFKTGRGGLGTLPVWAVFNVNKEIKSLSLEAYAPLLCTGQTDVEDKKAPSGFGAGLDLLAPGFKVPGIVWYSSSSVIAPLDGSSLAAPCVAGVAALVLSVNPDLKSDQLAKVLCQSCDPQVEDKKWDPQVGWGRLNAKNAVELAIKVKQGLVVL
jgi:hypothetical protein